LTVLEGDRGRCVETAARRILLIFAIKLGKLGAIGFVAAAATSISRGRAVPSIAGRTIPPTSGRA